MYNFDNKRNFGVSKPVPMDLRYRNPTIVETVKTKWEELRDFSLSDFCKELDLKHPQIRDLILGLKYLKTIEKTP
jgi:hypothetical protein